MSEQRAENFISKINAAKQDRNWQQVFDFIARKDDQWPVLRQPGIEKRLAERRDGRHDLSIGQLAPIAGLAVAIRDHERIGHFLRPLGDSIDDGARIGRQLLA